MKLLIIGAGRMGIRHAIGASAVPELESICMADINIDALITAKEELEKNEDVKSAIFQFLSVDEVQELNSDFDVAIISTTAQNRGETCSLALGKGITDILIEKPLGQSREEVESLVALLASHGINGQVNFSRRLYPNVIKLKEDLRNIEQFQGDKVITMNAGAIGIGAMGIHYLDLLFYLLDADTAEIISGEIEDTIIQSGRGAQFEDYGGWCSINFYDKESHYLGRAHLSISCSSSVFGGFDIIGSHGRIRINELERERTDIVRKPDSDLPTYRYSGDYLPPVTQDYIGMPMVDITTTWLNGIVRGEHLLPSIMESQKTHALLFDWLELSKKQSGLFSFT